MELIETTKGKDNLINAKDTDEKFIEYIKNKTEEELGEHRHIIVEKLHLNREKIGEWNIHARYTEGDRTNQRHIIIFRNEWKVVSLKLMGDTLLKKSSFSDYMLPHLIAISCLLIILIKSTNKWTNWMTGYYSFIKDCQHSFI